MCPYCGGEEPAEVASLFVSRDIYRIPQSLHVYQISEIGPHGSNTSAKKNWYNAPNEFYFDRQSNIHYLSAAGPAPPALPAHVHSFPMFQHEHWRQALNEANVKIILFAGNDTHQLNASLRRELLATCMACRKMHIRYRVAEDSDAAVKPLDGVRSLGRGEYSWPPSEFTTSGISKGLYVQLVLSTMSDQPSWLIMISTWMASRTLSGPGWLNRELGAGEAGARPVVDVNVEVKIRAQSEGGTLEVRCRLDSFEVITTICTCQNATSAGLMLHHVHEILMCPIWDAWHGSVKRVEGSGTRYAEHITVTSLGYFGSGNEMTVHSLETNVAVDTDWMTPHKALYKRPSGWGILSHSGAPLHASSEPYQFDF
ncbi:hypothetical protein GGX14DRAFT_384078 [Mycena pura]|uniref:Uncharacterized protein n=1 Tax=Mycena pura TaxID=153505 RepID=A0AAD6YUN7_9AGAR|nr:hypothetical protein GGX14DRAFT_384078 [Mycena pura]